MKEKTTILLAFLVLISVTFCNFNKDRTEDKPKEQTKEKTVQTDKNTGETKSNDNNTDSKRERYPIKKNNNVDRNDNDGCTYWITSSSHKRHNKSCRWYKNSNGYCTDKQEGVACKICGG